MEIAAAATAVVRETRAALYVGIGERYWKRMPKPGNLKRQVES